MVATTERTRTGGFTLVELLLVLSITAMTLAIALPRMRVSPERKARMTAEQLVLDLEVARSHAMSSRKAVRVVFDTVGGSYSAYLDHDGDGAFVESEDEMRAMRGLTRRRFDGDIRFGRGSAPGVPGTTGTGPITLGDTAVVLDARGMTAPFGTLGTLYVVHQDDASAVAAVEVAAAGSFTSWAYREGAWR